MPGFHANFDEHPSKNSLDPIPFDLVQKSSRRHRPELLENARIRDGRSLFVNDGPDQRRGSLDADAEMGAGPSHAVVFRVVFGCGWGRARDLFVGQPAPIHAQPGLDALEFHDNWRKNFPLNLLVGQKN